MYLNDWSWSVRPQHVLCLWTKLITCVVVDGSTFVSLNACFFFLHCYSFSWSINYTLVWNAIVTIYTKHHYWSYCESSLYLQFSPLIWTFLNTMGVFCYICPLVLLVPPVFSLSVSDIFITSSPRGVIRCLSRRRKINIRIF
jgi:hypothetical protein